MLESWREQSLKLSYIGHARLKPLGTNSATLSPTHLKGGPWMRLVQHRTMLTARLVRALTGHAPVASFRQHFGFTETDACACGLGSETVGHVFHRCSEFKQPLTWFHPGKRGDISSIVKFLRLNPKAFSFSDRPDIVDPEGVPWKLRGGQEVHFPILSLGPSIRRSGRRLAVLQYLLGPKLLCLPLAVHCRGGGHFLSWAMYHIRHPY